MNKMLKISSTIPFSDCLTLGYMLPPNIMIEIDLSSESTVYFCRQGVGRAEDMSMLRKVVLKTLPPDLNLLLLLHF